MNGRPSTVRSVGGAGDGREAARRERQREGHDLDGQPVVASQHGHQLLGPHQDDLALGCDRHDALAHQRPAIALDEVEPRVDLVGPVDRQLRRDLVEPGQRDAELAREPRRGLGGGNAAHRAPRLHLGPEGANERRRRAPRPEPDHARPRTERERARGHANRARPGSPAVCLSLPWSSSLVAAPVLLHQLGHEPGPARLVARPEPRARVPVEILVEQDEVAPVWIDLESRDLAVRGPAAGGDLA